MKRLPYIFKIILPVLVAALGLVIVYKKIDFYPLLLGLIIGVFNWNLHRINSIISTLICVIASYVVYGISILSFAIYVPIEEVLSNSLGYTIGKDQIAEVGFIITPFVIAPILMFLAVKFIFKTVKRRHTTLIIFMTILVLVLQALIFHHSTFIGIEATQKEFYDYPYILWVIIMVLAIQLILFNDNPNKSIKNQVKDN
ncbi:hypothetical protein LCL86_00250 [Muricauda ruestringensis]|uniref:hypothetical protein n=1 Tax=Flagellimonas ruestringensis TaxID=111501 RepID=UPI001CD66946|nr:hypothetical protein [Allomuricauda ruestringensis]MCA0957454.1 hypothetical protein [Allomuricauda ruestringensis]